MKNLYPFLLLLFAVSTQAQPTRLSGLHITTYDGSSLSYKHVDSLQFEYSGANPFIEGAAEYWLQALHPDKTHYITYDNVNGYWEFKEATTSYNANWKEVETTVYYRISPGAVWEAGYKSTTTYNTSLYIDTSYGF